MAIQGQQSINIGFPNEAIGSDSLYTAFNKAKTNFETLFACASPYSTVTGNVGIFVNPNASAGTLDILNTGVIGLVAGSGIALSGETSNSGVYTGNVTISGSAAVGNVTSVGVVSNSLVVFNSPITSSGNIEVELPNSIQVSSVTANTITAVSGANLGNVSNLTISGGSSGFVLSTDGTGNLSWIAQTGNGGGSGSSISNGTSNVNIATSGGNVTTSVGGNANVLVVTSTGVNVAGTLNTSGNISAGENVIIGAGTGGSIIGANLISASYFAGSGQYISDIPAANVVGNVSNALLAQEVKGTTKIPFTFDNTTVNVVQVSANSIITEVSLVITTPFNGTTPTISIGDASNANRLMSTTDSLADQAGTYTVSPGYKYATQTQIIMNISSGSSSQGDGLLILTYY